MHQSPLSGQSQLKKRAPHRSASDRRVTDTVFKALTAGCLLSCERLECFRRSVADVVELRGLEPLTLAVQRRCSPS